MRLTELKAFTKYLFKAVLCGLVIFCLSGFQVGAKPPVTKKQIEYYSNGKIKSEGKLKNGHKQGTWSFYNEEGVIVKQERWKKGKLKLEFFYENGKLHHLTDDKGKTVYKPSCGCT